MNDEDFQIFDKEQMEFLKVAFTKIDQDGSGEISKEELKSFCNSGNLVMTSGQLDFMFNIIDSNGNGEISFEEFLRFVLLIMAPEDETVNAQTIFNGFDKDKNG